MGTALYSGLPGILRLSLWQKKKLSLWPIWQTTQRQVVVAFLVDYIVLYLSIARSLETYYSVKRDLLQCQKRPTTVSKETY